MGAIASNKMQALKLKGHINESGQLQLSETINLAPGEVEIIILKLGESGEKAEQLNQVPTFGNEQTPENIQSFVEWFTAGIPPATADFDADEARWEVLKDKHKL